MNVKLLSGTVRGRSLRKHYQQLYTGFLMLAQQSVIRLRQAIGGSGLLASVDGKQIYYDVSDGPNVDQAQLEVCDAYFKRSYYAPYVGSLEQGFKVQPLGLNYEVYPDEPDWRGVFRSLALERTVKDRAVGALHALRLSAKCESVGAMQGNACKLEPRVLFLARTHEPRDPSTLGTPSRQETNEMRAECIAALRREFGERALAGFAPSALATRHYRPLLAPVTTEKARYLVLLRQYPICVATTGVHGSIGWKMGEYVAFGKAIVSERLYYEVPEFRAKQHYLEFQNVDQCVAAVGELFDRHDLRRQIIANNVSYYQAFLRPDRLVLRTLLLVKPVRN